jgi:predicted transcriptional regulator
MGMVKDVYHPNAYLSRIKNFKRGLRARSLVLNALERHSADGKTIGSEAGLHYGVVIHHLKLLAAEGLVESKGSRPHVWSLTGLGQKRLTGSS